MQIRTMKNKLFIGITVAAVMVFAFSYSANAEFSLLDRVAQVAGNIWGERMPVPALDDISVGAMPGGDTYNVVSVHDIFTQGGGCLATTTAGGTVTGSTLGAVVLTEAQMLDYNCFQFTFNQASTTVTLPATSTMISLLPEVGDMREWTIHNATTTTAIELTIGAGSGIDLIGVATDDDVLVGTEWSRLSCWRTANSVLPAALDITCITSDLVAAD